MKKFEELKLFTEKADKIYFAKEHPIENGEYFMMLNKGTCLPETILALLADREQLRRTLESFATPENITHTMYPRCICHSCFARETLKKSDECEF